MEIKIIARDGPARLGNFIQNKKEILTPNIFFIDTKRINAPSLAEILISHDKSKKDKPILQISDYFIYPKDLSKNLHLLNYKQNNNYYIIPGKKEIIEDSLKKCKSSFFIIANAAQLFKKPSKFVDFIVDLREKVGYEKSIYLPSIGNQLNFSLFSYMGIDFFDSVSAIIAARNNNLFFSNEIINKNDLLELPCNCPSCNKLKKKPNELNYKEILNHNYFALYNEIKQVRNLIRNGNLRNYIEKQVKSDPTLTAILRNLDKNHYDFLEQRTSISSKGKIFATSKESLNRPEIIRYQKRVTDRYQKPKSAKLLLLLPCSAKKPYSFSKTHKLFKEKINLLGNSSIIHELIITSPIGIVPRDLELVYPASSYDIPVTGIWDEDEKKMIRTLLLKYLKKNKYEKIIVHLPKEIIAFIDDIIKNPKITCIDTPTSKKSLDNLFKTLKSEVNKFERVKSQVKLKENILNLASYQFGKNTAKTLLKECNIKGKYPYQKIIHNKTQLGMIIKERGLISLTINGAERVSKTRDYWVNIYDDFTLKGSVFAPGVKDADEKIRIGDEVIVIRNKKLAGVGVAQMNGCEMKTSKHGEAVKMRHRT